MYEYGIDPDSFKWPDVYLLSQMAPSIFGRLNKGMRNRMGQKSVLPSNPLLWGIFKANIPFPLSVLYNILFTITYYPFLNIVRLKDPVQISLGGLIGRRPKMAE